MSLILELYADALDALFNTSNVWDTIISWILLILTGILIFLIFWLLRIIAYSLYRHFAYDYESIELQATVASKNYRSSYITPMLIGKVITVNHHPNEHNVRIITKNGLTATINDEGLYYWAAIGAKLQVTMKIGRNRRPNPEIKYWRVTHFLFGD